MVAAVNNMASPKRRGFVLALTISRLGIREKSYASKFRLLANVEFETLSREQPAAPAPPVTVAALLEATAFFETSDSKPWVLRIVAVLQAVPVLAVLGLTVRFFRILRCG